MGGWWSGVGWMYERMRAAPEGKIREKGSKEIEGGMES